MKCSDCVTKATRFLNEALGEENWEAIVVSL